MQRFFTKHRVRILVLVIGCLFFTRVLISVVGCEGRISQANCDRVRIGMTEAEVEGILGRPNRDYLNENIEGLKVWASENGWIFIDFDVNDRRVTGKSFFPSPQPPPLIPRF